MIQDTTLTKKILWYFCGNTTQQYHTAIPHSDITSSTIEITTEKYHIGYLWFFGTKPQNYLWFFGTKPQDYLWFFGTPVVFWHKTCVFLAQNHRTTCGFLAQNHRTTCGFLAQKHRTTCGFLAHLWFF